MTKKTIDPVVEVNNFTRTEARNIKYVFDNEEKLQLAEMLALQNQDMIELEDEKKSAMGSFASRISMLKEQINNNSNKVANGFEFRDVECNVRMHSPIEGKKTITRNDTQNEWVEEMNSNDFNLFTQFKNTIEEAVNQDFPDEK